MNKDKQLTIGNTMKKVFMILGIIAALHSTSHASEWKVISNDLNGYNFYTNKLIKGANF
jgi:hypothetical protein